MSAPLHIVAPAPWSLFAEHGGRPFAFFIDRGHTARASFAGSQPSSQLVVEKDGGVRVWRGGAWQRGSGDPIECIEAFVAAGAAGAANLPDWLQGEALPRTVGYLGYELGAWADGPTRLRARPSSCSSPGTPLAVLSTYDVVDAWDPHGARAFRVRFEQTETESVPPPLPVLSSASWTPTARDTYRVAFDRILAAIGAGEIYQANLSRRAVFSLPGDVTDAYRRLRAVQPVPWGAFLDFGGFALLSNSPECFLARSGDRIVTRPIKGTRPRRGNEGDDAAEITALRSDPKEKAEHLMIVDLERNDLGRVARIGSVEVSGFGQIESYATVHHMVSKVAAVLKENTGLAALLRATFPGGSITGAPKLRAMEILAEVEDSARGPYCGAIGYFDGSCRMELSIAIRTAIASAGRALYSTGGGIVADSDPDREWEETELKVEALRRALAEGERK